MPESRPRVTPKYVTIAEEIRRDILSGRLGPGDRVPGENALMERHHVARMTARQALGVLAQEGLTVSRKGRGVFVRSFEPIRRRGIQRLASDGWRAGRSIWSNDVGERSLSVTDISVREEPADERVALSLGVEPDARVCVRDRRFVLDGEPVMLATSYLPSDIVRGSAITQRDTGAGGVFARLAELGHEPVHAVEELLARMPSAEEAAALRLSTGTPVIRVRRTAYTAERRAVDLTEMTLDASSYVLEYAFDL
jgi:GntR family transcriptional regulator